MLLWRPIEGQRFFVQPESALPTQHASTHRCSCLAYKIPQPCEAHTLELAHKLIEERALAHYPRTPKKLLPDLRAPSPGYPPGCIILRGFIGMFIPWGICGLPTRFCICAMSFAMNSACICC